MKHIKTAAKDGFLLETNIFEPKEAPKGIILVCPGLGIPKEFYFAYCTFLSGEGYLSVVFDYRGIGNKKDASEDSRINLRNWGIYDIPAILNWTKEEYPKLKVYFIGHSIGGQIAGLIKNHPLIERFIFVSSTGGYWREFNFPLNLYTYFLFFIQIPLMIRFFGYMPKSLTYRGVAISKGVASEWAEWSRKKEYIRYFLSEQKMEHFYNDINQKIDWIWFEDDPIATERALGSMMKYYPNAQITRHAFNPKEMGVKRIGHSGFFTKRAKIAFWKYPLTLIET